MKVGKVHSKSYLAAVVLQFALTHETRLLLDEWVFLDTQPPIGMRAAIVQCALLVHRWCTRAVR